MKAYTDYPFLDTDEAYKEALIREINLTRYDGDKYCYFIYEGKEYEVKAGYVYKNAKRFGEAKPFSIKKLNTLPKVN